MSTPLVECDHVARTFRTGSSPVVAVADLDVAVPAAARWAVQGPSGSGKSTVLHLLAGLDRPTSGSVRWPGLSSTPPFPVTEVGMVFQGGSLLRDLDALENVAFPLQIDGVGDDEAFDRANAALDTLSLQSVSRSLPDRMSGGQAQRVSIARVLACRPRLILADEPTGQLDSDTAARVVDTLILAADDIGAALIVSTHDPHIAARFPTRWQMSDGRLVPDRADAETSGNVE